MQETFILLKEIVWRYSPRILIALGILFIGFWIINRISGLVERMISSRKMDETLKPFLKSMINVVLKLALIGFLRHDCRHTSYLLRRLARSHGNCHRYCTPG
ncbi:MAG: hypothetical protein IPK03_09210 [Bacteroidetes bacterium]|nr:hypothetical protein [Bacteroidota bacterium]